MPIAQSFPSFVFCTKISSLHVQNRSNSDLQNATEIPKMPESICANRRNASKNVKNTCSSSDWEFSTQKKEIRLKKPHEMHIIHYVALLHEKRFEIREKRRKKRSCTVHIAIATI